ncbi:trypsin-like serine protease [Candidatus Albibeggiatoa sp. nov. NOAA]|uniref:trypsin-like serine protease n=1 Tax=Candidatus Albibeggiatoa sp. nov. NOAA TaxID=3162724 RepID=UPI0032FB4AA5|nr:trypsin-like serine protease [Thiotrichaceae bacterium]
MRKLPIYMLMSSLIASPIAFADDSSRLVRIVNGEKVTQPLYPWMVELRDQGEASCGASVIDASWILTAAHCVTNLETGAASPSENIDIRVANLNLGENGGRIVKVKRIVLPENPSYNPQTLEGDIALLELEETIDQTPVTLLDTAAAPIPVGTQAMLTGWGRLAEGLNAYISNIYGNDSRLADTEQPEPKEDEDPIAVLVDTLSKAGISNDEIIKVVLAAPQIGLKTPYDDTTSFLNKAVFRGTPGFQALANALGQDPNVITLDALMQIMADSGMSLVDAIYTIDEAYGYRTGQLQKLYYPIVAPEVCQASGVLPQLGAEEQETAEQQGTEEQQELAEEQQENFVASLICAGFEKGGSSDCSGDSGGPLTIWNGELGEWTQVGLVSFSSFCAAQGNYDVYTRVSHYTDFIKQHVPNARFVTVDYQDMSQCHEVITPAPFAPKFTVNQQQTFVKLHWEPSSYAQQYVFTFAPYSNPISDVTFDNVQSIPLDVSQTVIDTELPQGSDYYVTVQAQNCAGMSEHAPIQRLKVDYLN